MSCGTSECGCGCEDLVQLKIPPKEADALKKKEVSEESPEDEQATLRESFLRIAGRHLSRYSAPSMASLVPIPFSSARR